jgi:hypothetical protein
MIMHVNNTPTPTVSRTMWTTEEIKARLEEMDIPRTRTRRVSRWGNRGR